MSRHDDDWPEEQREARDPVQERIVRRGRRASWHMGADIRRDVEPKNIERTFALLAQAKGMPLLPFGGGK